MISRSASGRVMAAQMLYTCATVLSVERRRYLGKQPAQGQPVIHP